MTRLTSHLLILLILFTHSTVAMDVSVCHDNEQTSEYSINADFSSHDATDTEQGVCLDAGGHCSHNQAHTAGLIAFNTLTDTPNQLIVVASSVTSVFIHPQKPPLRPPKT